MTAMRNFDKWKPPFRVGRKQSRAILDSNGIELVIFPEGAELYAKRFCEVLNDDFRKSKIHPLQTFYKI